jgi:hypothetical protein
MSIVWPCPLTVDAYALMGRAVKVPRPQCPSCLVPAGFWSGYWRHVRRLAAEWKIFIPRVRCGSCGVTHAVLPAFVLVRRLDAAESAGAVIGQVASGVSGVRPAAAGIGVPYTTARGLVRRFAERAGELAVSFAALCAELGGEAVRPDPDRRLRWAAGAVGAAFEAASGLPGWAVLGAWRFASAVTGGSLLAANASSPWLIIGGRRFMPPRSS